MARASMPTNGAAIRRHRQLAGWNATPFAAHIGISRAYLGRLESGERHASPTMLKRIADALGVTVRDLADLSDAVSDPAAA